MIADFMVKVNHIDNKITMSFRLKDGTLTWSASSAYKMRI